MDRHPNDRPVDNEPTDERINAAAAALSTAGWSRPASAPLGFKIQGENAGDAAGFSVAGDGDFNGDGFDDLVIGALNNSSGGYSAGAAYVVFGTDQGFPSLIDLDDVAQGQGGFKIQGENSEDWAGATVASAADVNGDGIDDVIVGAWLNDSGGDRAGAAYVVFGTDQGFANLVDLDAVAQGQGGLKIQGETAGDVAAYSGPPIGDVDGDGFDDLIIGAPGNDDGGSDAGAAYIIFGSDHEFSALLDLDAVAQGQGGVKIRGANAGDRAGYSVAGAGDINGDGIDDVILGAQGDDGGGSNAGAAYVVFGTDQGFPSLVDLDAVAQGQGGLKIQGEDGGDLLGLSVDGAGDVNGDGIDDLILAGFRTAGVGANASAAYVVFGTDQGFEALVDLDDVAQGQGGFRIQDESANDNLGFKVAGAGDVNGDGVDDLIVGARFDDGPDFVGAAYVVFGKSQGFPALVDLDAVAQGQGGFKIQGENELDRAGKSVSAAGDVNGDGVDDLIVGALGNNSGGSTAGAAYVIFGRTETFPATIDLGDLGAPAAVLPSLSVAEPDPTRADEGPVVFTVTLSDPSTETVSG